MKPSKLPIQKYISKYNEDLKDLGRLVNAFLTSPKGVIPVEVRQGICSEATRLAGGNRPDDNNVPDNFKRYVKKCALYAYRVVDKDMDQMKAKGHSEDEIFEVTHAAVLGASLGRLERGLALLEGDEE